MEAAAKKEDEERSERKVRRSETEPETYLKMAGADARLGKKGRRLLYAIVRSLALWNLEISAFRGENELSVIFLIKGPVPQLGGVAFGPGVAFRPNINLIILRGLDPFCLSYTLWGFFAD